jgi:WD40 repeat protein
MKKRAPAFAVSFLLAVLATLPLIALPLSASAQDFELVIQNGHTGSISGVRYSPDGRIIATGIIYDNCLKLWDSTTGLLLRNISGVSGHFGFSPDGRFIASGCADKKDTIAIWDISNGRRYKTIANASGEYFIYSPDGKFIASGSSDKSIKIWNASSGALLGASNGEYRDVYIVKYSPDGRRIAAITGANGYNDGIIKVWNAGTGALLKTLEMAHGGFQTFEFSPDGKSIASATATMDKIKSIKVWDVATGTCVKTMVGHTDEIPYISYSPNGKYIASGSYDKTIKIWDIGTGNCLRTLGGHSDRITSLAYSPDGRIIASGSLDTTIKTWNSSTGALLNTLTGNEYLIDEIAYSPDGRQMASGAADGSIKIWDMATGDCRTTMKRHTRWIYCLAYAPDGKFLASGSDDGDIRIFDAETGALLRILSGHILAVKAIAYSPDGKFIASGSDDKSVRIWDAMTGACLKTLEGHSDIVYSVAYSSDGKSIISGALDNTVNRWDAVSGSLVKTFTGEANYSSLRAHSPGNGRIAAVTLRQQIKIYDTETGTILLTLPGHPIENENNTVGLINCLSYSPDGRHIASASQDKTIKIWDAESGTCLNTLRGHTGWVEAVAYSLDGRFLASGDGDGLIRIWRADTWDSVALLALDDEDWIIYSNDGIFDSSPNGGRYVGITKGLSGYPIDQFAVRSNRPDILLGRMGLIGAETREHYYSQFQRRLRKLGFVNARGEPDESLLSADLHVPSAEIAGIKQEGKRVDLALKMSDSSYKLKRYNVYVNNVPLFGAYGKAVTGSSAIMTENIEVTAGENKIEVSCMNEKGAESYRALCYANYDEPARGDLYFLAFGISNFKNPAFDLKYADKDAKDLASAFGGMKGYYANVYARTYLNNDVTTESIKAAKAFLANATPDDTFVLFIAGHGIHDVDKEATYYYITYDSAVEALPDTAANFESIENILQGIGPRKKLFLMDTCESGEAGESSGSNSYALAESKGIKGRALRGLLVKKSGTGQAQPRSYLLQKNRYIYNDLVRRSGAIVFSSSRGDEASFESDLQKNGHFTKKIIEALKGAADKDNDGFASIDELRDFVCAEVPKISCDQQHPTVDRDNICARIRFPVMR